MFISFVVMILLSLMDYPRSNFINIRTNIEITLGLTKYLISKNN